MTTQEYIAKAQERAKRRFLWRDIVYIEPIVEMSVSELDTLIAKTITDYREMVEEKLKKEAREWVKKYPEGDVLGFAGDLQDLIDKI